MKNKITKLLLISLIMLSYSTTNGQTEYSFLSGDTGYEKETSLNSMRTFFCNDGIEESKLTKSLSMVARPGEEKEICIIQFNLGSQDLYSRGSFPESNVDGDNGGRYCNDINDRNNPFAKFIKPFSEKSIKIPAKGYVIRKTTIKFPIGVKGMQYGCFAYGQADINNGEGQMFAFVTRKVQTINILVAGEGDIKSEISIKNIEINTGDGKKISIGFDLENKGSVEENINANLTFSNMFGFKKFFSITGAIIGVNNSISFDTKDLGEQIELPRYKGPFKVSLEINYKPYFNFDISNAGIDSKILAGGTLTKNKTMFIFPTIPAIGLLVFILLIYLAFFRKPKVIIQQAPITKA